jgi:ATP-dependent DNA helicase RecG
LRDEKTIVRARNAAEALLSEDPALAGAPDLADAVAEVERSAASAYLDKG